MRSRKSDIPADDNVNVVTKERAKQNTGHELEVQTKDL